MSLADRIDEIDHCPEGGERELLTRIIYELFAPVLRNDPNWPKDIVGKMSDSEVKQYLVGLRDRLVGKLL